MKSRMEEEVLSMRTTLKCFLREGLNEQPYIDAETMRPYNGQVNDYSHSAIR